MAARCQNHLDLGALILCSVWQSRAIDSKLFFMSENSENTHHLKLSCNREATSSEELREEATRLAESLVARELDRLNTRPVRKMTESREVGGWHYSLSNMIRCL